ncbi:AAA family ATPase [Haliangium sp.]|uniref:AAA family ATPase n=1 Tax=Haliangium sp. TaxID=2663208 RepID=UPI003D116B2B
MSVRATRLKVPTGIDDFRKLRELGLAYVDKSELIEALIDDAGTEVALFPRPRRFGKSLNLSMLRCWFEKQDDDLSHLFEGLAIWDAGEAYRAHFQRYPVIHLSFKAVKPSNYASCRVMLRKQIQVLFDQHRHLLDSPAISEREARDYRAVLDASAEDELFARALLELSAIMHRHYGEKVVILIDEYDGPIHAAYLNGYAQELLDFLRAFFTDGLKGNPHLYKAVLTGILRVARESIFSGLNNLTVYSLLEPQMATAFGFTEAEVQDLLTRADLKGRLSEVRSWYNGYDFGGHVIYNPWSVTNFIRGAQAGGPPRPYWLSTSANLLIKHVLEARADALYPEFEALLSGGGIERPLDENVALDDLTRSDRALWNLLVFSGYLKAEEMPARGPRATYRLSIPNQEVRLVYADTFYGWMEARLRGHGGDLRKLTGALLEGNVERFEEQLQALALNLLSYHDGGSPDPEGLYHGFVLGLLAVLEPGHRVRSNRESGKGRPDVMIAPSEAGQPGVLLELKVARPGRKSLDQALAEGLSQIAQQGYDAELRALGADPIHSLAVAFDGKEVRVRAPDSAV